MVGVGGVDAADQGIDEPFVDLVAEAAADERADRVVRVVAAGEQRLGGGSELAPERQQPGGRQPCDVGRHAEQDTLRDRVQPVVPDGCGRRGRRRQVELERAGEIGGVGHAGEEGVGALVDGRQPGERGRVQLAAEPLVGFAQLDRHALAVDERGEERRRRQPADPATDDEDALHVARMRSARAPITAGSSFIDGVRRNTRPTPSARRRASMSRS